MELLFKLDDTGADGGDLPPGQWGAAQNSFSALLMVEGTCASGIVPANATAEYNEQRMHEQQGD